MAQTIKVAHFPYGGGFCRTIVTMAKHPVNKNSAMTGNIADGVELFEWTDGVAVDATDNDGGYSIFIDQCNLKVGLIDVSTAAASLLDTPTLGLGTLVASGAVTDLTGTPSFDELIVGAAVTNCTAGSDMLTTVEITANAMTSAAMVTSNGCFLNIADGWAGTVPVDQIVCTGVVIVDWRSFPGCDD